ncbi:kinase-like domain-containing protein [Phlebopus sp. FC_14]|nr:kinase-like domain-containing protein [Phlebopus sp. FC_14]
MSWLKEFVRRSFSPTSLSAPRLGPVKTSSARLEEQIVPGYRPDIFFPIELGKTYHDRYHVLSKLGYGVESTVWLARDTSRWAWLTPRYAALKVLVHNFPNKDEAYHEYNISRRIASADPSHAGARCVRTTLDAFELQGPHGQHVCLVYEPMRETLPTLEKRVGGRLSPGMVKELLKVLLRALDYLHTRCHVVHTDIKKDNILFCIRDMSIVDDLVRQEAQDPSPRKLDGDYTIYTSRGFEGVKGLGAPKLADFGLAVVQDGRLCSHSIQPDALRSPEVILGIPWTYSVDIWNLGALAWEFLEMDPLFRGFDSAKRHYTPESHLAEMAALLGHPPNGLLDRSDETRTYFTPDGAFRGTLPARQALESRMRYTPDADKSGFAGFIARTLRWRPEERPSAAELLRDPWIQSQPDFAA